MLRIGVYLYVFFQLLGLCTLAQNSTSFAIEEIKFEGLKKTKLSYVHNIISTRVGDTLNETSLQEDVQSLKNTFGIGHTIYAVDTIQGKAHITFSVEEVRTALPIANFGGIRNNVWFQVGFADIHWLGRGQTLSAYYQNTDRRHSGQIYYHVPRFGGKPWGGLISISRWASKEPFYFPESTVIYNYDNNSLALAAIRHFGRNRNLQIGGTYFIEKYVRSDDQDNAALPPNTPEDFTKPKWLSKLVYQEDFLDYDYFMVNGLAWHANLQNIRNISDNDWFHSFQMEARQYVRIKERTNLAFRLRLAISTNTVTPFAPFVADSHVNLRGVGNRVDRGTAQLVLNAEYRFTAFRNEHLAIQAVAFSDAGTWRNPGGDLGDVWDPDQFRQFVGGGCRFVYPKVHGAILRIDYGIDIFDTNTKSLVVGFGQYF